MQKLQRYSHHWWIVLAGFILAYFALVKLGLYMATDNQLASPVWPASGLGAAILIVFGPRYAMLVLSLAFIGNLKPDLPLSLTFIAGLSNMLEALLAYKIMFYFKNIKTNFDFQIEFLSVTLTSIIAPIVSCTIGTFGLYFHDAIGASSFYNVMFTWYLGDALGILIILPLFYPWYQGENKLPLIYDYKEIIRGLILTSIFCFCTYHIFLNPKLHAYTYVLMMTAVASNLFVSTFITRFMAIMISAFATYLTLEKQGPFFVDNMNDALLMLQFFLSGHALLILTLSCLDRAGRPRLANGVLYLSVLLSGSIFYYLFMDEKQHDYSDFKNDIEKFNKRMSEHFLRYEDALIAGQALFQISDDISAKQWNQFVGKLKLETRFPGIQGLGFIDFVIRDELPKYINKQRKNGLHDFHLKTVPGVKPLDRGSLYIIRYIEPIDTNIFAQGLDVGSEIKRRMAADFARDHGVPAVTEKISLVQDINHGAGFLHYYPIYQSNKKQIKGWIYVPFIIEKLMDEFLKGQNIKHFFTIFDGGQINHDGLIYTNKKKENELSQKYDVITKHKFNNHYWSIAWQYNIISHGWHFFYVYASYLFLIISLFAAHIVMWLQFLNIRAQERADERNLALKDSELRLRSYFESSLIGLVSTDVDGHIIDINDAFLNLVGYERDEVINSHIKISELTGADFSSEEELLFGNKDRKKTIEPREMVFKHKNQGTITVLNGISYVDTKPPLCVFFMVDISWRKKMEQELIDAKNAALKAMNAKSYFMANMSHELRTPLNGIIGIVDHLLNSKNIKEQNDYLDVIKRSSLGLNAIINDILDFSKIEAEKLKLEQIRFNLHEIIDDTKKQFLTLAKPNVKTNFTIDNKTPRFFMGDPLRVTQILNNLLGNAVKFTDFGEISLNVYLNSQNSLCIDVSDTGSGIDLEMQKALFEPFTQLDISTSRKYGGTGLGLSITKRLVNMMEGIIQVESQLGKGSIFKIILPLKIANNQDQTVGVNQEYLNFTGKCVLIVEDNIVNQSIVKLMLEKCGLKVYCADNGQLALDFLFTNSFPVDLVLMDCQMPVLDGFMATQLIRSDTRFTHLPIVALTANVMDEDKERCLQMGMNAYLSKPLIKDELMAILAKYLS